MAHPVLWIAVATSALRLPYLFAPMSSDEGGFLVVGGQWHHGTSLYGDLWVDRPPLLIAFFRLADLLGGLTPLRLLGCLVTALIVVGTGLAARELTGHHLSGRDAGPQVRWAPAAAAAVVGALLVTASGGASVVNGELLAAPFIAFGLWAALVAVRPSPRAAIAALAAGACGAAALLVKQNMLDVGVFAVVLVVATAVGGQQPATHLVRQSLTALLGAVLGLLAVLLPAWAAGTSPLGVYDAMYPFRVRAAGVMNVTAHERIAHGVSMVTTWSASLGPLLLVAFAVWAVRRGLRSAPVLALLALLAYDVVSVAAGGSYWLHYVVQLAVPSGLAAALLVARTRRLGALLTAVVVLACSVGWATGMFLRTAADGPVIGEAIGAAAQPDDTLVSLLGDGDIVRSAGLRPAYTYLWSLPARTLDPHLTALATTLQSPDRPTWVVVRGPRTLQLLTSHGIDLRPDYRQVVTLCRHPVFLRVGVDRATPVPTSSCTRPFVPLAGTSTNGALK